MTNDNLYQYPQRTYNRKEVVEIIISFLIWKLEALFKFLAIIFIIVAVIALYKGNQAIKFAEEQLKVYEEIHPYTEQFAARQSIEEMGWNYIRNLEIPDVAEVNLATETTQLMETNAQYIPFEEERQFAYRLAFGEAGTESELGQILVINVAINNMRNEGYSNLIEEFTKEGRYSSVIDGEVYNCGEIVSENDVPQNVKDAVDAAFICDYSEKMLREQAKLLGINDSKYWEGGALYFYNPKYCSEYQNSIRENIKVKFECGNHLFYRYWDK